MGNVIYKLQDGLDLNKLKEAGFDLVPGSEKIDEVEGESVLVGGVFVKVVPQALDSDPVKGSLNGLYNNPNWKEKMYKPNAARFFKVLGLKYNKKGEAVMTEKFKTVLTSWRIQIDTDDGWVGFTSADKFDQAIFYAKKVLDDYCSEDIKFMKENQIIEETEVNE